MIDEIAMISDTIRGKIEDSNLKLPLAMKTPIAKHNNIADAIRSFA
jgi:hypothetical protein